MGPRNAPSAKRDQISTKINALSWNIHSPSLIERKVRWAGECPVCGNVQLLVPRYLTREEVGEDGRQTVISRAYVTIAFPLLRAREAFSVPLVQICDSLGRR